MSNQTNPTATISLPSSFVFGEVSSLKTSKTTDLLPPPVLAPSLGPLAAFVGNWTGSGFNTIFRPNSSNTPTQMPGPITTSDPDDNVLELNLTSESLSFSPSLGSVPNRGMVDADAFLNGVPYLQAINDVTTGASIGIHVEPGLWMCVPSTTDPAEGQTLVRMGSIPHGTTIQAQGTSTTKSGPPTIPVVDITPFITGSPLNKIPFQNQDPNNPGTRRIPQDLSNFMKSGTITQKMLGDPNTLLRDVISQQIITNTTEISISTNPVAPLFGGGTDNIAFLQGSLAAANPTIRGQNAQTLQMTATFWIETVEHIILVPIFKPGQPPLIIKGNATIPGHPAPIFSVHPPIEITVPRSITVISTQIQYSQTVMLNFNGLTWPHVSVATLVPNEAIHVPPSVWEAVVAHKIMT